MTKDSIEPTKKFVASYEEYFTAIPDDHLLAMIVNPMLAIRGFAGMKSFLQDEGYDLIDRAKKLLKGAIKTMVIRMLETNNGVGEGGKCQYLLILFQFCKKVKVTLGGIC